MDNFSRASEDEVRQLHERWFEQTAAKDLDGLMAPIAEDVVSYEHEAPLQYVGVDAVREVCRRGLNESQSVKWSVPDLTVLASGNLAVAWGLNHIEHDGAEIWTRGTRIFERRNGTWVMIHQHLSIPLPAE